MSVQIPQKIQELANKVRTAIFGKDVREAIAEALEESGKTAAEAREITESLLDGSFDQGLLDTEIREKLTQLEQDYAPQLNDLGVQLAQTVTNVINVNKYEHLKVLLADGYDWSPAIREAVKEAEQVKSFLHAKEDKVQLPSVLIPAGRIKTVGSVIIETPLAIIGTGGNSSVIEHVGSGSAFIVRGEIRAEHNPDFYLDAPKTSFFNLGIVGNKGAVTQHGIMIEGLSGRYASRAIIEHCSIYNMGGHGIYSKDEGSTITSNRIYKNHIHSNNLYGIYFEGYHTDCAIEDNIIRFNKVGIYFDGLDKFLIANYIRRNLIESNRLGNSSGALGSLTGRPAMGIVFRNCVDNIVSDNYFESHWVHIYGLGMFKRNYFKSNRYDGVNTFILPSMYGTPTIKTSPIYTLDATTVIDNVIEYDYMRKPNKPSNVSDAQWRTSEWGESYEHLQLSGSGWLIKDLNVTRSGDVIDGSNLEVTLSPQLFTHVQMFRDENRIGYMINSNVVEINGGTRVSINRLDTPDGEIRYMQDGWRKVSRKYGVAPPTTGSNSRGEIIWNEAPEIGKPFGWQCVTSGTPGTWESLGMIGGDRYIDIELTHSQISTANAITNLGTLIGGYAIAGIWVLANFSAWDSDVTLTVHHSSADVANPVTMPITSTGFNRLLTPNEFAISDTNRSLFIKKNKETTKGSVRVRLKLTRMT